MVVDNILRGCCLDILVLIYTLQPTFIYVFKLKQIEIRLYLFLYYILINLKLLFNY